MTNESKQSQTSGSKGSESTKTKKTESEPARIVRLRSLLEGGGDHPGSGLSVPAKGIIFEAGPRGHELVAAGLAEVAPEGVKGE